MWSLGSVDCLSKVWDVQVQTRDGLFGGDPCGWKVVLRYEQLRGYHRISLIIMYIGAFGLLGEAVRKLSSVAR